MLGEPRVYTLASWARIRKTAAASVYPRRLLVSTPAAITIYLPEPLRTYAGGIVELPVSARTVRAMLAELAQTQSVLYRNVCDETGAVRRHLNIFVNADNVRDLDGLATTLKPGDVVTIVPAVSGG